mgnify:CR=1 FL=1
MSLPPDSCHSLCLGLDECVFLLQGRINMGGKKKKFVKGGKKARIAAAKRAKAEAEAAAKKKAEEEAAAAAKAALLGSNTPDGQKEEEEVHSDALATLLAGVSVTCASQKYMHSNVKDIKIGNLNMGLYGAELLVESELNLNWGRRYAGVLDFLVLATAACADTCFLHHVQVRLDRPQRLWQVHLADCSGSQDGALSRQH